MVMFLKGPLGLYFHLYTRLEDKTEENRETGSFLRLNLAASLVSVSAAVIICPTTSIHLQLEVVEIVL